MTATENPWTSYVTVFPSGSALPTASTLNLGFAAATANMTIVPLGPDGAIDLSPLKGRAEVLVRVSGPDRPE